MIKKLFIRVIFLVCRIIFNFFHDIYDLLNIKYHSKKFRIMEVHNNNSIIKKNSIIAIFVIYQKNNIPFYIKNVLNVLNLLEIDIIISVNDDLVTEEINWLIKHSMRCIVRKNFGRDFCAYKDAIELTDLKEYEKLILLNDSLIYFSKNLLALFKFLINQPKSLVGLSESFENSWHIQSHFLILTCKIFLSNNFKNFWNDYKPFNSRSHSIIKGEIKFSEYVLKYYAQDCFVYYSINTINKFISCSDVSRINFAKNIYHFIPNNASIEQYYRDFSSAYINDFNEKLLVDIFLNSILSNLEKMNPSHALVFLTAYITNTCLIKRDLVFKESYSLTQVENALLTLNLDRSELEYTIREYTLRGSVAKLPYYFRFKFQLGFL